MAEVRFPVCAKQRGELGSLAKEAPWTLFVSLSTDSSTYYEILGDDKSQLDFFFFVIYFDACFAYGGVLVLKTNVSVWFDSV